MYFSLSEVKNDRAAQLALMTANELGERMMVGEQANVAFESAIASMSRRTGLSDIKTIAAQLLAQDDLHRKTAIRIGMGEIVNALGGEINASNFFKQVALPRAQIRFESVGGVRDDLMAAKGRASLLAIRAGFARKLDPDLLEMHAAEAEYVEFVKSVYRTLEASAVDPKVALDVANEINGAALADIPHELKGGISDLQQRAIADINLEARERVMARYRDYKPAPSADPSVH